jgi:hypothetical protein
MAPPKTVSPRTGMSAWSEPCGRRRRRGADASRSGSGAGCRVAVWTVVSRGPAGQGAREDGGPLGAVPHMRPFSGVGRGVRWGRVDGSEVLRGGGAMDLGPVSKVCFGPAVVQLSWGHGRGQGGGSRPGRRARVVEMRMRECSGHPLRMGTWCGCASCTWKTTAIVVGRSLWKCCQQSVIPRSARWRFPLVGDREEGEGGRQAGERGTR